MTFYSPRNFEEDAQVFSVGYAQDPPRWKIDKGSSAAGHGWDHVFDFWAFTSQKPGTEVYSVSYATDPWRYRVNMGESDNTPGWTQYFTFWAYPHDRKRD